MAQKHGMIEPFVDGQVREGNISYGLSSYGYDIRIADEFKIFTNVNNAIIDPKDFSDDSFVDFKGEVCIIPPNSFVLGKTVEYFRIPRNTLTVCLGKCVTGDTRVVDADTGEYRPISELEHLQTTVGMNDWTLTSVPVSDFIPNGIKPVYELTTQAGLKIKATANHPFRQLDGWIPLENLKIGDRIAIARHIPVFGSTPLPEWEAALLGMMISEGQCDTPGHSPTYTTSDPVMVNLLTDCVHEGLNGQVTKKGGAEYGYRLVNSKGRGGIMTANRATVWLKQYGLDVTAHHKFVPQAIFTAPRENVVTFLQTLFAGDGSIYHAGESIFLEYYSASRRLIEDVHHLLLRFGIFSLIREKVTQIGTLAYRIQITDREQIRRFADEIGFWANSEKQLRLEQEIMPLLEVRTKRQRSNFDTLPREGWKKLSQAARTHGASLRQLGLERTQPDQSLPFTIAQPIAQATKDSELTQLVDNGPIWDVVKSIEYVGEEAVFDLTVPHTHNFIANGIIVHNSTYARCGLIVNVTPFEPEWEGFVTLEISNTTPLPAKVYANEGIAQVLFFRSDVECEISYADRKGKYQKQAGIILPKL